ncbi:hypothetical protein BDQ17DRAFT_1472584 [Cyathus striatus]|nr:hypothetical protein BDQ17DRAFT_1472584 [Cyathus striatus]
MESPLRGRHIYLSKDKSLFLIRWVLEQQFSSELKQKSLSYWDDFNNRPVFGNQTIFNERLDSIEEKNNDLNRNNEIDDSEDESDEKWEGMFYNELDGAFGKDMEDMSEGEAEGESDKDMKDESHENPKTESNSDIEGESHEDAREESDKDVEVKQTYETSTIVDHPHARQDSLSEGHRNPWRQRIISRIRKCFRGENGVERVVAVVRERNEAPTACEGGDANYSLTRHAAVVIVPSKAYTGVGQK